MGGPGDRQEQGVRLPLLRGPVQHHPGRRQLQRAEAVQADDPRGPRANLQAAQGPGEDGRRQEAALPRGLRSKADRRMGERRRRGRLWGQRSCEAQKEEGEEGEKEEKEKEEEKGVILRLGFFFVLRFRLQRRLQTKGTRGKARRS